MAPSKKSREDDSPSAIPDRDILSATYLEKHSSKKDLTKRLWNIVNLLRQDESIEPDDVVGLGSLASCLMQFVHHRDKQVRLYSVSACMELFAVYAPEAPWDEDDILAIFSQTLRQLANLANAKSTSDPYFGNYMRILELWAQVKIGVVLVELTKQGAQEDASADENDSEGESDNEDSDDDETQPRKNKNRAKAAASSPYNQEALDLLAELFRTVLHCVRHDHPPEVGELIAKALSACVEEYCDGMMMVPIPLLDEILMCVGQGPTVMVPKLAPAAAMKPISPKNKKRPKKPPPTLPMVEQVNPCYVVAASVIRKTVDRISTPVASLLNGLFNGEHHVLEQTALTAAVPRKQDDMDQDEKEKDQQPLDIKPNNSATSVWSIVYELHRIAPHILTTVIGTVSAQLASVDAQQRLQVVHLLGRLFGGQSLARQFRLCFREWLRRITDVEVSIRLVMVPYLIPLLASIDDHKKEKQRTSPPTPTQRSRAQQPNSPGEEDDIGQQAEMALSQMIEHDPMPQVRLDALHAVCEYIFKQQPTETSSPALLQAVGSRVRSKHKQERKDAVTGLAQIYHQRYMQPQLQPLKDTDDWDVALQVLHQACPSSWWRPSKEGRRRNHNKGDEDNVKECYGWIPRLISECLCYSDANDPEMRSRVLHLMDFVLLGKQTPTARAVGLAIILDSLREDDDSEHRVFHGDDDDGHRRQDVTMWAPPRSNAYSWVCTMLMQRAQLQKIVGQYLDARSRMKRAPAGTEAAMKADAEAIECLQAVASKTAPPASPEVLDSFHQAKDKHLFRLLSTVSHPLHSSSARAKAIKDLPQRAHSLGPMVVTWLETLVRRCAMGSLCNADMIVACLQLARQAFDEKEWAAMAILLKGVQWAVLHIPLLAATSGSFDILVYLFLSCREAHGGPQRLEQERSTMLTTLTWVMAQASTAAAASASTSELQNFDVDESFREELFRMCARDGTPEQARHGVEIMAAWHKLQPQEGDKDDSHGGFGPLIKTLTSPSRLSLHDHDHEDGSGLSDSVKVISLLSALSALVECAPAVFCASSKGGKAVRFAVETILLGRDATAAEDESGSEAEGENDDEDAEPAPNKSTPSKSSAARRSAARRSVTPKKNQNDEQRRHFTPGVNPNLLEDGLLSVACRRACAAISFLTSHIRSTILESTKKQKESEKANAKPNGRKKSKTNSPPSPRRAGVVPPSEEHIHQVFDILFQILRDEGLLLSSRDRRDSKSRQDRAVLRHYAAVHILRLCDARLHLERKFLTPDMWLALGGALLDEERFVRESVMEELSRMLTGQGVFGAGGVASMAPSLRFLALIVLCCDADSALPLAANGNAANVGKRCASMKNSAMQSIVSLRKTCEAAYAQCCAIGEHAEDNFESNLKMMLMPEYAVPFAIYILCFRRETPSAGGAIVDREKKAQPADNEDDEEDGGDDYSDGSYGLVDEEGQQKMLRKRLRWLFEPLVHSLGDSADNISFLLRMAEVLGNRYRPVDVLRGASIEPVSRRLSLESDGGGNDSVLGRDEGESGLPAAKLKVVCAAAREVLMSFVKTDVNLPSYPGSIQYPGMLFRRTKASAARKESDKAGAPSNQQRARPARGSRPSSRASAGAKARPRRSERKSRVHFSPETAAGGRGGIRSSMDPENEQEFDGLSPIGKSDSPLPVRRLAEEAEQHASSAEKTLGTTPPSILRSVATRSVGADEGSATGRATTTRPSPVSEDDDSSKVAEAQGEDKGKKPTRSRRRTTKEDKTAAKRRREQKETKPQKDENGRSKGGASGTKERKRKHTKRAPSPPRSGKRQKSNSPAIPSQIRIGPVSPDTPSEDGSRRSKRLIQKHSPEGSDVSRDGKSSSPDVSSPVGRSPEEEGHRRTSLSPTRKKARASMRRSRR